MTNGTARLRGIVRGRTIELDTESGLADGQQVTVLLRPVAPAGDGLRQSAGGWADAGDAIDEWLEEMQRGRQHDRPEPN
jgi:hypothetical protein